MSALNDGPRWLIASCPCMLDRDAWAMIKDTSFPSDDTKIPTVTTLIEIMLGDPSLQASADIVALLKPGPLDLGNRDLPELHSARLARIQNDADNEIAVLRTWKLGPASATPDLLDDAFSQNNLLGPTIVSKG